jgi:hypothetical protein
MGPFDNKGRSILDEWAIESLSMALSRRRKHKEAVDMEHDERDMKDVLETLTAMSYVVVPLGVLENVINELRKALTGGQVE